MPPRSVTRTILLGKAYEALSEIFRFVTGFLYVMPTVPGTGSFPRKFLKIVPYFPLHFYLKFAMMNSLFRVFIMFFTHLWAT